MSGNLIVSDPTVNSDSCQLAPASENVVKLVFRADDAALGGIYSSTLTWKAGDTLEVGELVKVDGLASIAPLAPSIMTACDIKGRSIYPIVWDNLYINNEISARTLSSNNTYLTDAFLVGTDSLGVRILPDVTVLGDRCGNQTYAFAWQDQD